MKKLLVLLFLPLLFTCSSDDSSELFLSDYLSSLDSNSEMYWTSFSNSSGNNYTECVYFFFQDGYVYNERCTNWNIENETYCIQDWFSEFPLNEISIVSEDESKIVFVYDNETMEVRLNSSNNSVQIWYNSDPNHDFITTPITQEQLDNYIDYTNYPDC